MQAKKSLGQHFLIDKVIIEKIMKELRKHDLTNLLEVGPGAGALTKELLSLQGIHFKAVEIDDDKVAFLKKNFPELKDKIIHDNFLNIQPPFDEPFIIIGNFPYNISTEILFKILEWKGRVPVIIGMFQKEVAQRLASPPGSKVYGVTSALIQPYYNIEYLFDVPPNSFQPPPKVVSAMIRMTQSSHILNMRSEKDYRLIVKTGFSQRRKKLRNPLKGFFSTEVLKDPVFDKRAEELSIDDFAALTHLMK